jgi:hypothetical protein
MESDLGLDEQPPGLPSLEEDLVQQFGPNMLAVAESIVNGEGAEELEDEASDEVDMTNDFIDDSAPMDLTSGTHNILSDSDDDDEEPEENPL